MTNRPLPSKMVERAAKAAYENQGWDNECKWDDFLCHEGGSRNGWIAQANAALSAAGVGELMEALDRVADPNQNDYEDWEREQDLYALDSDFISWIGSIARSALAAAENGGGES